MKEGDLVRPKHPSISCYGEYGWGLIESEGINYMILNTSYRDYVEYAEILPGEWVNTKDLEVVE